MLMKKFEIIYLFPNKSSTRRKGIPLTKKKSFNWTEPYLFLLQSGNTRKSQKNLLILN